VLGVIIKPYAVLLLPWVLARGRIAAILTAGAGGVAALLLPAVVYGPAGAVALHREWWRTVTDTTAPQMTVLDNVSLAAMFYRWAGPGELSVRLALIAGLALLLVAAIVFLARRGVTFPEGLEGGLLLTLMPLLSPQGWDYGFLIATPAVVYLANYSDRLPGWLRILTTIALVAIGLSIFDVMGRRAYGMFLWMSGISLGFFVVIGALATLRFRKVA
jgi:hypothetical protein